MVFNLDDSATNNANSYQIQYYDTASGTWVTSQTGVFTENVELQGKQNCDQVNGTLSISFKPDGTTPAATPDSYICVMDEGGSRRFRTGITSTITGKIAIQGWNGSAWK